MIKIFTKKINISFFLYVYFMKFAMFRLVFTVFLLWLTIKIPKSYELVLAYASILTIGIIHGANDLSLINYITKSKATLNVPYLVLYLGIILITVLAFINLPFVALVLFVIFSCYHFGEQHLHDNFNDISPAHILFFSSYGLFIFGLLFITNPDSTISIIEELTSVKVSLQVFQYMLITAVFLILISGWYLRTSFNHKFKVLHELFLLVLFFVIFKLADLIWAFAIYFIIWHSVPSLKDQIESLYKQINKRTLYKYFKTSFINWLISVIGLFILYYLSDFIGVRFITLFFAFLAAITIPHVIVMYFLNKK